MLGSIFNSVGLTQELKAIRLQFEHYKKAAEQNYLSAQFNLGTMYYNGRGTAKDYVRAYMWFSLSGEDVVSTVAKQKMVDA